MPTSLTRITVALAAIALLGGCAGDGDLAGPSPTPSGGPTPTSSPQATPSPLIVTSADFVHDAELPLWTMGDAFSGQCAGDNLNPQLAWTGVPDSAQSVAITMLDETAGNYVHWVHANIPTDVVEVPRGESDSLSGTHLRNGLRTDDYFGPCPPRDEHRYTFTVWALDTTLELEPGATYGQFVAAITDHVVAQGSITGVRGPWVSDQGDPSED